MNENCCSPDFEECDCECHENLEAIKHRTPCCEVCPICEMRVKTGFEKIHEVKHKRGEKIDYEEI
ncbi:MAG: hypothetical protein WC435_01775 [Candidatus Paceibacterota bacterium]